MRTEEDRQIVKYLSPFNAKLAVYAGYMCIASKPLVDAFIGVNVHPADLTIEEKGKRKYVGKYAVRDALLAGEQNIRSSIHIVEEEVDNGQILMISSPVKIESFEDIKESTRYHQAKLKRVGDWNIFPKAIQYIAEGRYSRDSYGNLFFDNIPAPRGIVYKKYG